MKLSEAIRLGAMMSEQGFDGGMREGGKRCVLAAVADACGIPGSLRPEEAEMDQDSPLIPGVPYVRLRERFPELSRPVRFPHTLNSYGKLATQAGEIQILETVLWGLNDSCHWTREQIADWVETVIEPMGTGAGVEVGGLTA